MERMFTGLTMNLDIFVLIFYHGIGEDQIFWSVQSTLKLIEHTEKDTTIGATFYEKRDKTNSNTKHSTKIRVIYKKNNFLARQPFVDLNLLGGIPPDDVESAHRIHIAVSTQFSLLNVGYLPILITRFWVNAVTFELPINSNPVL